MGDNGELHVVFGSGPVGLAVMDELLGKGKRVRMINRSGRARVPKGVEVVGGDATDRAFAREASEGASVVYFALNPPYTKWAELFPPLQAGVVDGAAAAGAKLIAMENLYMYGLTGGRSLTEDAPFAPNTRKGAVRAAMSEELMGAHNSGRVRVAVGRASDFFGPRVLVSAAGEQVFGRAVQGKGAQVAGDPDQPHTYTYMPNIGKGLVILAGGAYSPDYGDTPGEEVTWTSNRQGFLGSGQHMVIGDLRPGRHHIRLSASDGQGGEVNAGIWIFVGEGDEGC